MLLNWSYPALADDGWAEDGVTDVLPNGLQVKHGHLCHPNQDAAQSQSQAQPVQTGSYYRTDSGNGQPAYVNPQQVDQIRDRFASYPNSVDTSYLQDLRQEPLFPTALREQQSTISSQQYFNDPLSNPDSYGAYNVPQGGTTNPGNPTKNHPIRDGIGEGIKNAFTIAALGAAIGGLAYGAYKLNQSANRQYNNPYYYNSNSPYGSYSGYPGYTYVNPYTRSNGTFVPGHYRTIGDGIFGNNWSTVGNVNPMTGMPGYKYWP